MKTATPSIPVVNLEALADDQRADAFVATFGDALRDFGFVTVEGHGIDPELIRRVYGAYETFFELGLDTKTAYEVPNGNQRGYTRFGKEHAKDTPVGDLKEFWHVGRDVEGYPPNVWPTEVPGLKEDSLALFDALETCAFTLIGALERYFGLPAGRLVDMIRGGNSILRAIHYPPIGPDADPRAVRASAHEDINFITLLCEAKGSGLELLTRQGTWLPIEALDGQIVVDAGDMLSRITNGRIPATTHRVVNHPEAANISRYSLPYFVHPHPEALLECLPGCSSPEDPPRFPPVKADDFLKQRLREIGLL